MAQTSENLPDPNYFSEAVRWEVDVIRSVKRSRTVAWIAAAVCATLAGLAMLSLVMLLPLKTFEPYVIEVDKTTGFMEIKRPLAEGPLTQNEAIARMYIVRFLKARESYDPDTVKSNYELAHLLSTGQAQQDLNNLFAPSDPNNPVTRFGRETEVIVEVKSIQMSGQNEATVRFSTQREGRAAADPEHWVALMRYRYISAPMENSWRFENPLGFQVTDYRRDQESLSGGEAQ